jgi:hypothetical protein
MIAIVAGILLLWFGIAFFGALTLGTFILAGKGHGGIDARPDVLPEKRVA